MKIIIPLIFCVFSLATAVLAEIPVIHCPAEPPLVRRLEIQERWRIDAEDPDAPLLGYFDQSQIVVNGDQVYLLDRQLCQVLVYSHDGEHLNTIMREGEGPGEIRNPRIMFMCVDGRIAVTHGFPTRIEFVDPDGTPQGRWRIQSNSMNTWLQETDRGWFGIFSEYTQNKDSGDFSSIMHVALYDDDGRLTDEFFTEPDDRDSGHGDEIDEHQPWYTARAVDDGQIVYAPFRDQYRLEWRNLSGETTRIVTRDFKAHRRTREELDELKYRQYVIENNELAFVNRKLSDTDPMIRHLEPLPDGSLRVRTSLFSKELPDGMICRYEIHEATGELRERVEIYDATGDFDIDYDILALLDGGSAMVLRNLRPTYRTVAVPYMHPDLLDKLPPVPDDREDIAFTPIMCDLVPALE
jgi:hypothetical protein